ncbi:MAG: hypothetical protein A4E68_02208 [Syntrophaceae bacterium PtaB.Bin095]|nr:MAG: hypothetical protein A4E68_02208 [Syntrophaceae bacterium PtaB.Bin095]
MRKKELLAAIANADGIFREIMGRYAGLKGYLVFSSPFGQCELTGDLMKIAKEFPDMLMDTDTKREALKHLEKIQDREPDRKSQYPTEKRSEGDRRIKKGLRDPDRIADSLEVKGDTFVEIRFSKPVPDLIFQMQKDPLVSREHTPQTEASVRIVLGTIEELSRGRRNEGRGKNDINGKT